MDPELIKQLIPAAAGLVAALVAIMGWFVAHRFNVARDVVNKRRELRIQYLFDAYRRLESNANRERPSKEANEEFESALADIQLLGTHKQVIALHEFIHGSKSGEKSRNVSFLLDVLRTDLRDELGLESDVPKALIFRFDGKRS